MSSDIQLVREALSFIPASDRDLWVKMGMAVKSEFGDDGFQIWDSWSQGDGSYNAKDSLATWKSLKSSGGITIRSLFKEAKDRRWVDDPRSFTSKEITSQVQPKASDRIPLKKSELERIETARKANAILGASTEALADHPYLVLKQVSPTQTLREIEASVATKILGYPPRSDGEPLKGRLLVVPVTQDDRVSTLELIDGDKRKSALQGRGTKAGGYWSTEQLPEAGEADVTLLIGEGVATTISGAESTGLIAIAALSSGNLVAVAKAMRIRYPGAKLVILADLVKSTGEPDQHATEAASAVGGVLAVPDFGPNREPDKKDFNDLAQISRLEAVKIAIENATSPGKFDTTKEKEIASRSERVSSVGLIRASDVSPQPIKWLWPNWLSEGKLHILAGSPGTGKTTIGCAFAATVSAGGPWPDGTESSAGNVVIWSGEDDCEDTLRPRLGAMGADLSRVLFVDDVVEGGEHRTFDPARDIEILKRELLKIGEVKLLVIDPVVSAISGDSNKNAEVRRGLQPLVDLASSMRCALLGITHFSKATAGRDPVERITGSLAFGAFARVVLVAAKHQEAGDDGSNARVLCRAKSNIGPDGGGVYYELQQLELENYPGVFTQALKWGHPIEGEARDLLDIADARQGGQGESLVSRAAKFLTELLADGPIESKLVRSTAREAGFSEATINRAKSESKLLSKKIGMNDGWMWCLPDIDQDWKSPESSKMLNLTEDTQQILMSNFENVEHLRDKALQPLSQHCSDCQYASRFGNCNEPVRAGLSDHFKLIAHQRNGMDCKMFSPKLSSVVNK